MKTISVIFGRSHKPISIGIQLVTRCKWSHVGLLQGSTVIEARGGFGVVATPLSDFVLRYSKTETRLIHCANYNVVQDIQSRIGRKYDDKAFWGIALGLDWDDINAYQCAELIGKYSGNFDTTKAHRLTPKHILLNSHAITCSQLSQISL